MVPPTFTVGADARVKFFVVVAFAVMVAVPVWPT